MGLYVEVSLEVPVVSGDEATGAPRWVADDGVLNDALTVEAGVRELTENG